MHATVPVLHGVQPGRPLDEVVERGIRHPVLHQRGQRLLGVEEEQVSPRDGILNVNASRAQFRRDPIPVFRVLTVSAGSPGCNPSATKEAISSQSCYGVAKKLMAWESGGAGTAGEYIKQRYEVAYSDARQ